MRTLLALFILTLAAPGFGQTPADENQQPDENKQVESTAPGQEQGQVQAPEHAQVPAQGEQNRSALDVSPGTPAIKNKDLYEKSGILHPFRRMPGFVLMDQKRIWTSPFRTSKKDIKWWVIFGGATAGLIAADKHISKAAPNSHALTTLGSDVSYLGEAYTLTPIAAGFYFLGSVSSSERFRETGLLSFETLINAAIADLALKTVFDRQRPLEGAGNGEFEASGRARYNSSFPSGHATVTFALASVFAHEYRHNPWVQVLVYSYAGGVVGARLAANQHFPGDVLSGGALGWFIGDYVYAKRHNPDLDEIARPTAIDRIKSHIHIGGPQQAHQLDDPDAVRSSVLASLPHP